MMRFAIGFRRFGVVYAAGSGAVNVAFVVIVDEVFVILGVGVGLLVVGIFVFVVCFFIGVFCKRFIILYTSNKIVVSTASVTSVVTFGFEFFIILKFFF